MFLNDILSRIRRKAPAVDAEPPKTAENDAGKKEAEPPAESFGPYRTDAPLEDEEFDLFDRAPFANRIADTIGKRTDPSSLVVAVYGPWGDGKTTVLNFIRNRLRTYPAVTTVNFNPWRMEGEQALLQGFFLTLADALDRDLATKGEKLGEILKRYGTLLKVAPGGWGDAAVGAGTALSTVSIDELKVRIGSMLREANRRVVILMDVIDRLVIYVIMSIFRLVKLTGDFENTAYVLAFDEQMVAIAIGEKYAATSGKALEAGANFLEKIVQVPLHLPAPAAESLREYCFDLVNEALNESTTQLNQNQVNEFVSHFNHGLEIRIKTPRMAKRYANALHFSLTILKGETYPPDLMLIEGMRIFFPELYDAIRRNPESVLRTQSRDRTNNGLGELIATNTQGMTNQEKAAAASLVEALFPRTGTSLFGSDWDKEFSRDQRIASSYYFQRYFTYGVNRSDVPDIQLNAFVASLSEESAEEPSRVLEGMITRRNAERIIYKLRTLEETIQPTAAAKLSIAVARNASRYPDKASLNPLRTQLNQAAVHASQLVRRVPPAQRGALSLILISEAETLQFACECAKWLRTFKDSEREPILTKEEEQAMRTVLSKRIEEHCTMLPAPIYELEPNNTGTYLANWEWGGGIEGPRQYLSTQIARKPDSVFELMKCFLSKGWAMTTGLPIETDFDRDTYNNMTRFLAPESVGQVLRSIYGDQLNDPQFHLPEHEPREFRLANQFMFIFNHVAAELLAINAPTAAEPEVAGEQDLG